MSFEKWRTKHRKMLIPRFNSIELNLMASFSRKFNKMKFKTARVVLKNKFLCLLWLWKSILNIVKLCNFFFFWFKVELEHKQVVVWRNSYKLQQPYSLILIYYKWRMKVAEKIHNLSQSLSQWISFVWDEI